MVAPGKTHLDSHCPGFALGITCLSKFMERMVYLLVRGLLALVQLLPPAACTALGRSLGFLGWLFLPRYRQVVHRNLFIAFGKEKSESEIRAMTFGHFRRLGANLLGAARFFTADEATVRKHTTLENREILLQAQARGKGVVLMISHIGNWELFAQASFYVPEVRFGTVFQKVHNRYVNGLIDQYRRRLGVQTFDRKTGLAAAASFLRSGGVLGILIDQHAGPSGIWTPLFGKLTSSSPLAASLAVRTGAAVVPVAIYTAGPAEWRICIRPEIANQNKSTEHLTAEMNHVLEAQIRESPLDWFWVHNRWKLPYPEFLLARSKRGVYLPPGVAGSSLDPLRVVIRSSNWLGDAVMNVPAVRAVKVSRPDLHLAVLTPQKLADMWEQVEEVDEVLALDDSSSVFQAARLLREKFDVAIVLPNSFRTAVEVFLAQIPRRVGLPGHHRKWLLNQIPKPRKSGKHPIHHATRYLRIVEKLGANPTTVEVARRLTAKSDLVRIGICPGAEYGPAKRWPVERFRAVMEEVSRRRECVWVILGVTKDRPLAQCLLDGFSGQAEDLTGKTSLKELITELQSTRLLLTNDTGTMHLAALLEVPTVSIFGSTEPLLTGPTGNNHTVIRHQVECSPCFLRECPLDFRCMKSIEPAEVTEKVLRLLQKIVVGK